MQSARPALRRGLYAASPWILAAATAFAQTQSATARGTHTDASEAVILGVGSHAIW